MDIGDEGHPLVIGPIIFFPAFGEGVGHKGVVEGVWAEGKRPGEEDHLGESRLKSF